MAPMEGKAALSPGARAAARIRDDARRKRSSAVAARRWRIAAPRADDGSFRVIVTGHQLNTLPGMSVIEKVRAADAVIWMDLMQYRRHSWVNRNRFSDGTTFTIPVAEHDTFVPINEVRIADPTGRARTKVARTLKHKLGATAAPFSAEIVKPYVLLAGLNARLLALLLAGLDLHRVEHFQSHLGSGRYDDTSEGLAAMVAEVGGTVWLSGPTGREYLDERPFTDRGIAVDYFDWAGPNPTALEAL